MKIINNTDLDYSTIGLLIDKIMENSKETTHYVGQVEWTILKIENHKITVQIRYLKSYVEWKFDEVNKLKGDKE